MIPREAHALTGTWLGDEGALYYIRHTGSTVWWAGLSVSSPQGSGDLNIGTAFTNVYRGRLMGDSVVGEWMDTPRGDVFQCGTMDLQIVPPDGMRRLRETGGFGGAAWRRIEPPARKIDRIRAALRHDALITDVCAVIHGTMTTGLTEVASSGDLQFQMRVDPSVVRRPALPLGSTVTCRLTEHGADAVIPGWRDRDAVSILFRNGRPVNGDLRRDESGQFLVLGRPLSPGTHVRVTGALSTSPPLISPVYAVDVQDHTPRTTLTGIWAGDDGGTYYLRQRGDALCWLGLSPDWGATYTSVFSGVVLAEHDVITICGRWADLPLGGRTREGEATLSLTAYSVLTTAGGEHMGPGRLERLSDSFTQF
ncbi:hypothetical protein [Microbispora sp. NPDC049633]|uniref:hypothetical protein n=1 Tax=Microbispora sp. NPDC049633 TaxID=3154355 RepID=UPI0034283C4E